MSTKYEIRVNPKVTKVLNHLNKGIENCGGYTGEDFKSFCREFKSMILSELKLIGGTNYVQNNGHYYISGFFTFNSQVFYINISDVRYFNVDNILIRTAKDYRDFTGGTNEYIKIESSMFIKYIGRKGVTNYVY